MLNPEGRISYIFFIWNIIFAIFWPKWSFYFRIILRTTMKRKKKIFSKSSNFNERKIVFTWYLFWFVLVFCQGWRSLYKTKYVNRKKSMKFLKAHREQLVFFFPYYFHCSYYDFILLSPSRKTSSALSASTGDWLKF